MTSNGFEMAYAAGTPPWDVGRPQPAMVEAAESGLVSGRVLDAGCGTGELALYLADRGHDVFGVDASETAIERARERAVARGHDTTFEVADLLALPDFGWFDTVVDSGVLHVFDDAERDRYLATLAERLCPDGRLLAVVWAEDAPDGGPRRYAEAELVGAFGEDWLVEGTERTRFETTSGSVPAYLLVARRA